MLYSVQSNPKQRLCYSVQSNPKQRLCYSVQSNPKQRLCYSVQSNPKQRIWSPFFPKTKNICPFNFCTKLTCMYMYQLYSKQKGVYSILLWQGKMFNLHALPNYRAMFFPLSIQGLVSHAKEHDRTQKSFELATTQPWVSVHLFYYRWRRHVNVILFLKKLGGYKYKINNIATCHIVNFVFTPTQ